MLSLFAMVDFVWGCDFLTCNTLRLDQAVGIAEGPPMNRREWMGITLGTMMGSRQLLTTAAAHASETNKPKRACILLWMPGGPSQLDTFDLKPGHVNGGPFKSIQTKSPGLQISEHLPRLALQSDRLAVIRSLSSKEGDHTRASQFVRTGYRPGSPLDYPSVGPLIAKELADPELVIPPCVSIAAFRALSPSAFGSGFLGPRFSPLAIGENYFIQNDQEDIAKQLQVANLHPSFGTSTSFQNRLRLLEQADQSVARRLPDATVASRRAAYQNAFRFVSSDVKELFDVSREPTALRDSYGRNIFGQGCLLARRLVEFGVPFVEVNLNGIGDQSLLGWDTHQDNFDRVKQLSEVLDKGWSTLMSDLADRGLLATTTILWMGEFGRTPQINSNAGRDHFPDAWTAVLAGGGIAGGQAIGATGIDGMEVTDRRVTVPDLLATLISAMGMEPSHTNMSNVGRPIPLVDLEGKVIKECLS